MASLFASDTPPETAPATDRRMGVLLPLPLSGAYDYLVPEGMEVAAGDFVEVPLGSRSASLSAGGGEVIMRGTLPLRQARRTPRPRCARA